MGVQRGYELYTPNDPEYGSSVSRALFGGDPLSGTLSAYEFKSLPAPPKAALVFQGNGCDQRLYRAPSVTGQASPSRRRCPAVPWCLWKLTENCPDVYSV